MRKGVQKMRKIKSFMAVLLSLVMMGTMPGAVSSITAYGAQTSESEDTATLAASSGLGVESHTQEEIINHIKDSGALITDDTVYKTDYSAEQPYSAGVLDESTLNSGIAMLNNIRYIAGLNYDVALDDGFNEECQAGALINKINGSISHYPQQPSDMSDEMYQLAYKGCNESNIAWGYSTLNKCIVFGWMSDDDDGNISRVGHRAWCLNPTMGKTGFGVVDKKNSTYDIVQMDDCYIVNDDLNKIVKYTVQFCKEEGLPYYKKMQHEGLLRHLVIRRSATNGDLLVNLVTTTQNLEALDLDAYVKGLLELPLEGKIAGILHTENDSMADAVISDRTNLLYGTEYIYETVLGLQFKISPFSFFQTNTKSAERLYDKARSYVGDTKDAVIFDLYSGTGTIAQLLAPVAKKVIGVEIVEEAVETARVNAELNGLDNCEFIAGDVLKVIDDIEDKPDFIVLDPPRDGINPKALTKIINYGVKELVYISCKPTSLARDLMTLQEHGYFVTKACAVDQFPGTVHVETIVKMRRVD